MIGNTTSILFRTEFASNNSSARITNPYQAFMGMLLRSMELPDDGWDRSGTSSTHWDRMNVISWLDEQFPDLLLSRDCQASDIMAVLEDHASTVANDFDLDGKYLKSVYRAQLWASAICDDSSRARELFEKKRLDPDEIDRICWISSVPGERLAITSPREAAVFAWAESASRLFEAYDEVKEISLREIECALEESCTSLKGTTRILGIDVERFPYARFDCGLYIMPLPFYAARYGRTSLLELFMERCPGQALLETFDSKEGWLLLHHACGAGQAEIADLLLTRQLNVDIKSRARQESPLHIAVKFDRIRVLQMLLDSKRFDVNSADCAGYTPLHLAAKMGNFTAVRILIEQKECNLNAITKGGETALHYAARNGHADVVSMLLDFPGVNVNFKKNSRFTALHFAAVEGRHNVIDILLRHPAVDIHAVNHLGGNALHLATFCGHTEITEKLLDSGFFSINSVESEGLTCLHFAAAGNHIDLGRMLLHRKIDATIRGVGSRNYTALRLAAMWGHYEFVKMLLLHPVSQINKADASEMREIGGYFIDLLIQNKLSARSFYTNQMKIGSAAFLFYGVDEEMILSQDFDDNERDLLKSVFGKLIAGNESNVKRKINEIEECTIDAKYRVGNMKSIERRSGLLIALAKSIKLD
jgi:ankyrin repeat protein